VIIATAAAAATVVVLATSRIHYYLIVFQAAYYSVPSYRLQPNIEFTLPLVLAVFTRLAITLSKVNRLG